MGTWALLTAGISTTWALTHKLGGANMPGKNIRASQSLYFIPSFSPTKGRGFASHAWNALTSVPGRIVAGISPLKGIREHFHWAGHTSMDPTRLTKKITRTVMAKGHKSIAGKVVQKNHASAGSMWGWIIVVIIV